MFEAISFYKQNQTVSCALLCAGNILLQVELNKYMIVESGVTSEQRTPSI